MMDVDDAVMYLNESQSIGTGAYGEICPRSGSARNAIARRRCRRSTGAPSSRWTSGS